MRVTLEIGTNCFVVRNMVDRHTCLKTQIHPNHRQANSKVLSDILKESMSEHNRIYRGKEIVKDMNSRLNIDISYHQLWRGKEHALKLLRGDLAQSFSTLLKYCHQLQLTNAGSVTHIKTDGQHRFEMIFVAVGATISTFRNHLRPLIIIDSAHLKGDFRGIMFLAVVMDGNNQTLPIAIDVGKSESADE